MSADVKVYELEDDGKTIARAVVETDLPGLTLKARGKVRDVYDLDDKLLVIASDRISCFDRVLGTPIPDKGAVLNQLSLFWFDLLKDVIPNHFITEDLSGLGISDAACDVLKGRSMVVKKAETLPVECIVRGYLVGSGWKEYQKSGTVCGMKLRDGYAQAEKLDEVIFTPSTKAEDGDHDENISFEKMKEIVGDELSEKVKDAAIGLYTKAADHAAKNGVIIADTKFEFGMVDGELTVIDEVLTPDSSRFWPAATYKTGGNPESFDKQYVRDWLDNESGWNHEPPVPNLPNEVIEKTKAKYLEAFRLITGREF
ncbi:MAG: phosphoribosylaminoimidazolesuccinocarboxamide synthase [Planctomycetota bacterium]|jgi:phosphoribosylaminoimidazole-succinocarboxamide synthase